MLCMGPDRQLDQLVVEFEDLRIRVERAGGYQAGAGSAAAPSTTGSPPQGALAGPARATVEQGSTTSAAASDPGSWEPVAAGASAFVPHTPEWERALIAALTPEEIEGLDLSPVTHLLPRVRSSSNGWGPLGRLGRALRAGVQAKEKLDRGRCSAGTTSALTLPSKIYIILEPAPSGQAGWTDHYLTFRDQVLGRHGDIHGDALAC